MATQLLAKRMTQISSGACVIDITPPTFAGIATVQAQPGGDLLPSWLTATDALSGVRGYNVYIALGSVSSGALFLAANKALLTPNLSHSVYRLPNGQKLLGGQVYTVGVRAEDNNGNEDANVVILTASSFGVLDDTAANIAQAARMACIGDGLEATIEDSELTATIEDTELTATLSEC